MSENVPEFAITGDWLTEWVNECTCGAGAAHPAGPHERGCGLEPVMRLSELHALLSRLSQADWSRLVDKEEKSGVSFGGR